MDLTDPNSVIVSQLRHIGTLVAGALLARGWIGSEWVELVSGVVVAVGMMALAWINKMKAQHITAATVQAALALPADTTEKALNKELEGTRLPKVDLSNA